GPTLEPGLGLGLAGERLVAGSLPTGPSLSAWALEPSSLRGGLESKFHLQGDHTSQPPRESTHARCRYWRGRIRPIVEPWIQEEQCGFCPGRGTLDQLYTLRAGCLRVYGRLPNQCHMCFVDLEKAFDRVPQWYSVGVCREYGVQGPLLRAVRSLYDRSRSLVRIAGSKFRPVPSTRWTPAGLLLCQDLQHVLGWFAAECEAAGMGISTSKSEAMVLDQKRVACPLWVGGEILPQMEEFKNLGVLFTSEGKMEREINRRIGAASAVMWSVYQNR
ncbi:hypothetical protein L3Q82_013312, partial [Scortum barcoo]